MAEPSARGDTTPDATPANTAVGRAHTAWRGEVPAGPADITGLILAGGQSRRMGGRDKGLLDWQGMALVEHAWRRLQPQVASVLVSANRHAERYATYGEVVADPTDLPTSAGPLLGMAAGLRACPTDWLLCVPCDSPWLPTDLGARLRQALAATGAPVAAAWAEGRRQGVFLLLHRSLRPSLDDWLREGGRKVDTWLEAQGVADAAFEDAHAFANLNTPADWQAAAARDGGQR